MRTTKENPFRVPANNSREQLLKTEHRFQAYRKVTMFGKKLVAGPKLTVVPRQQLTKVRAL